MWNSQPDATSRHEDDDRSGDGSQDSIGTHTVDGDPRQTVRMLIALRTLQDRLEIARAQVLMTPHRLFVLSRQPDESPVDESQVDDEAAAVIASRRRVALLMIIFGLFSLLLGLGLSFREEKNYEPMGQLDKENKKNNFSDDFLTNDTSRTTNLRQFDSLGSRPMASPYYSLVFRGTFDLYRDQQKDLGQSKELVESGKVHLMFDSKAANIKGVRLVSLSFSIDRTKMSQRTMTFSGFDMNELSTVVLHSDSSYSPNFYFPRFHQIDKHQKCAMSSWLAVSTPVDSRPFLRLTPDGDGDGDWIDEASAPSPDVLRDLDGEIVSSDCELYIKFRGVEIDIGAVSWRALLFSLSFFLKMMVEIKGFATQIRFSDGLEPQGGTISPIRVSMLGLTNILIVDAFEAGFLFSVSFAANLMLPAFVAVTTFKILQITLVELRYLVSVWKVRTVQRIESLRRQLVIVEQTQADDFLRREANNFIRLFTLSVALGLVFLSRCFPAFPEILLLMYSFLWTPQIFSDVWNGYRRTLSPTFVVCVSAGRLYLPLYFWLVPPDSSVFDGEVFQGIARAPNPWVAAAFVFIVTIQVAVVFSQNKFGSRFFVPLAWLPHVYDYHRKLPTPKVIGKKRKYETVTSEVEMVRVIVLEGDEDPRDVEPTVEVEEVGAVDCVICMSEITGEEAKTARQVVTPCDHFFHENCLKEWMDVKMECPTCRGNLPPFP